MPPSLHAILGASSSHRWLACPPSARLSEKLDERYGRTSSEFAKEGSLAHELAEIKVRKAIYELDGMDVSTYSRLSKEEQEAYQGINEKRYEMLRAALGDIPDDMERATNSYCDIVMEKLIQARDEDPGAMIYLEQKLDYSEWVPSGFGTGDCIIVSDKLLEVCDYKHGKGIPVNAVNNPQIRLYALGAYARFRTLYDFRVIRGTIIQPRLESVTCETLDLDDLLTWAKNEVVEKAKLAWAGLGEFNPGEHCRFCSAKAVCSARVAAGLKAAEYGMETPGLISDEQIPDILAILDDLTAWATDFRAYCEKQALNGQKIPGYKLVHGKKPNRQWSDKDEVKAQLLRAGYNPEVYEETRLLPPGDVEKALGKTAFKAILGELVSQGPGKLTLVPESDKRIEYTSAEAAFSDMQ